MIPILIAIIAGYIAALYGIVDFSKVASASFFALPNFSTPKFKWEAIVIILPVILVIASEHIGHQIVTSKIVGRDLLKDPGLHRSLFADNFSTMISDLSAPVPTTTYGENIGVMKAVTKVYSVCVIAGARGTVDHLFFHWENDDFDQHYPRPCYRRNFIPSVRNDRHVRYPHPCRFSS